MQFRTPPYRASSSQGSMPEKSGARAPWGPDGLSSSRSQPKLCSFDGRAPDQRGSNAICRVRKKLMVQPTALEMLSHPEHEDG